MKTTNTQQHQGQGHDHPELEAPALGEHGGTAGGDAGGHVGEDHDGHAVADAALGDELTEPHDEGRARREGQADEPPLPQGEVGDQVDVLGAEQSTPAVVEDVDEAGRLQQGQADGEVPGGLGELLLAHRALVTPFLELGDHRGQQLDDDRAGDVGHDAQPEQGHPQQPAAGEEVEEAEDAGLLGRRLERLDLLDGDEGDDDVRPELVEADDEQGEEDLVAQVRDLEDVLQAREQRPSSSLRTGTRGYEATGW